MTDCIEEEQLEGSEDVESDDTRAEAASAWAEREWTIHHVLFPAMKLFLKPPNHMANDGTAVQVRFWWYNLASFAYL